MANRATLGEMRARALDRADMIGSSFPDTTQLNRQINRGLQTIYNMMVNSYEDYFHREVQFDLINGTEQYQLPDDHLKTTKVFYIESSNGNRRYSVQRFMVDEIDGYRRGPLSTGIIEHWYVPTLGLLTDDSDTVPNQIPPTFEEYAVIYAARYLLKREESHQAAQDLTQDLAELKQEITDLIEPRDTGEPKVTSDIYGRWSNPRWSLRNGRDFKYAIFGDHLKIVEFGTLGA